MTAIRLSCSTEKVASAVGQVGGTPRLPDSTDWPRCRLCETELVAFLEIVLPECPGNPFQAGSRLQIFACREHDDIAGTIYSDYTRFESAGRTRNLPRDYWDLSDGHYVLRLLPAKTRVAASRQESRLMPQFVTAAAAKEDADDGFKLFGEPCWLQDPEVHNCSCGAPMKLLLQIPVGMGFAMAAGAEKQPNSFSRTEYCLFLGNQLYLLGCTAQCDPLALWPVLQNC